MSLTHPTSVPECLTPVKQHAPGGLARMVDMVGLLDDDTAFSSAYALQCPYSATSADHSGVRRQSKIGHQTASPPNENMVQVVAVSTLVSYIS
ncbi:hypothetical protein PAXRUDRAFT_305453 [Paxillus rubicundulus Ve08.2h10]|uniref:Uncharacterized protein n=1 Tax=Paxillus rubicundulus Ve08.2h10 TaxID=930991 RepID=A0A0D0DKY9_9AGAM|nr:hypothetical protein PAXRUDRAFT_305453 [Paxillus rubicundulus Ve08.2h10]